MHYKPKTNARWVAFVLGLFLFTASFAAFKVKSTKEILGSAPSVERIEEGSKLFKTNCASCHALNKIVVGPALEGVGAKYKGDFKWIKSWIKNNEKLRASGDERALAIYNEYNGEAMNVFENLSDDEITSIIMWIENPGDGVEKAKTTETVAPAVDESLFDKINWGLVAIFLLFGVVMLMIFGILELVSNVTGKQVINWNNVNAYMMLVFVVLFFALVIWEFRVHGDMILKESASAHGNALDDMMYWTYVATIPVFFITQFLLFWFSFKYREKKGQKALYYPHNNSLELVWTVIPAIVLALLVSKGFVTWNKILRDDSISADTPKIELFAYQFGWSARYEGADGKLGKANYNLISGTNPLGVANRAKATQLLLDLEGEINQFKKNIFELPQAEAAAKASLGGLVGREREKKLIEIAAYENGDKKNELELLIRARNTQIKRVKASLDNKKESMYDGVGNDDIVVQEIHLVIDEPVTLKFRARDVIHSAYLPYFRTQMNVVPGLPTEFTFTPTITTNSMRQKKNDPKFDYYLVCNKICGNAHFNMKMKVVVEDKVSYDKWLAEQKPFINNKKEESPVDAPAVIEAVAQN